MDTNTLIAIVVTAVVTATARTLVSAIEDWLKRTVIKITENIRRIFGNIRGQTTVFSDSK
jgi:hypothetical protein